MLLDFPGGPVVRNPPPTLCNSNCINVFFDPSPRIMEIKPKINKWDLNSETFAQQRKQQTKQKDKAQRRRKYLQMM